MDIFDEFVEGFLSTAMLAMPTAFYTGNAASILAGLTASAVGGLIYTEMKEAAKLRARTDAAFEKHPHVRALIGDAVVNWGIPVLGPNKFGFGDNVVVRHGIPLPVTDPGGALVDVANGVRPEDDGSSGAAAAGASGAVDDLGGGGGGSSRPRDTELRTPDRRKKKKARTGDARAVSHVSGGKRGVDGDANEQNDGVAKMPRASRAASDVRASFRAVGASFRAAMRDEAKASYYASELVRIEGELEHKLQEEKDAMDDEVPLPSIVQDEVVSILRRRRHIPRGRFPQYGIDVLDGRRL